MSADRHAARREDRDVPRDPSGARDAAHADDPGRADGTGRAGDAADGRQPARTRRAAPTGRGRRPRPPILPDRAAEDRDESWGDRAGDDDERILRERPPHW